MGEITVLLEQVRAGDSRARGALFSLVYSELLALARARLQRSAPVTQLDAPALVHECFLRLAGTDSLPALDRREFAAYAAGVMRNVVVDSLRERAAQKRGGDVVRVTLVSREAGFGADQHDFEQLDAALRRLAAIDERAHRVVELRYFGGLSIEEVAVTLDLSLATVKRDWQKARAFLYHQLRD